jgi:predicted component of type VI protein secretion system
VAGRKVRVISQINPETKELLDSMSFALEKDVSEIVEEALIVYWNSLRDQAIPRFLERVAEFEMVDRGKS